MNTTDNNQGKTQADLERCIRDIGRILPTDSDFGQNSELFESGYLDSLGIVALTTYIEQHFSVTLTEQHLFDPRFTTIAGIAEIITLDTGGRSCIGQV